MVIPFSPVPLPLWVIAAFTVRLPALGESVSREGISFSGEQKVKTASEVYLALGTVGRCQHKTDTAGGKAGVSLL